MGGVFEGRGGFDWQPGWTPGPLEQLPVTVYPPFLQAREEPDTLPDLVSALIDAFQQVDLGGLDMEVLATLAQGCDAPVIATLVSLIHRARLAGPIPGRARPAPTGGRQGHGPAETAGGG
jgi:hypothetical protein